MSLAGVQEKLGVMNKGLVYALWDYTAQQADELAFGEGDALTVLRRRDDTETEWWWARHNDREGYIPRNLLGVRKRNKRQRSPHCERSQGGNKDAFRLHAHLQQHSAGLKRCLLT